MMKWVWAFLPAMFGIACGINIMGACWEYRLARPILPHVFNSVYMFLGAVLMTIISYRKAKNGD